MRRQLDETDHRTGAPSTAYRHDPQNGFCVICGTVWPCAGASRGEALPKIPVPRLPSIPEG